LNAVKFVSVTCDPDNDTPDALRRYADRFAADFGPLVFLDRRRKRGLQRGDVESVGSLRLAHPSDLAVVLDRHSAIRGYFHLKDQSEVRHLPKRAAATARGTGPGMISRRRVGRRRP